MTSSSNAVPHARLTGSLALDAAPGGAARLRRDEARHLGVPVELVVLTVPAISTADGGVSTIHFDFPERPDDELLRVVCRTDDGVSVYRMDRRGTEFHARVVPGVGPGATVVLSLLRFPTASAAARFAEPPTESVEFPPEFVDTMEAAPPAEPIGDEEAVGGAHPGRAMDRVGDVPVREPAHMDAEMPVAIPRGIETRLVVRLSRDRLTASTGVTRDEAVVPVDPAQPVVVAVALRGIRLADNAHRTRELRLPDSGARPARASFRLIGVDVGEADVSVVVRQQPYELPLATLRLRPTVTASETATVAERIAVDAPAIARPAQIAQLPTLRVDEEIADGMSTLHVAAVIGDERAEWTARLGDKAAFIDRVYARLQGIASRVEAIPDTRARRTETERLVRRSGRGLAANLLGDEVNALLWKHRASIDALLLQTSAEIDLPWEVVHLRAPPDVEETTTRFLADLGLMRWVYDTAQPRRIPVHRVVAVSPVYEDRSLRLARTAEEVEALRTRLGADPASPVRVAEVRAAVRDGFDLLHFAGHGRWNDGSPAGQQLLLAAYSPVDERSDAVYADADVWADLPAGDNRTHTPLVFLSACDVGRLRSGATGMGGFAEAFLRGGAGAFIGCGWAVRDDVASEFVRVFYDAAFAPDVAIAEATRRARLAARRAGDLSGLAYAVFADPRTELTTT